MAAALHPPWDPTRARAIIETEKVREGALLPVLHALQSAFGCVPAEALPMVAEALNISRAEAHGVASFYHDFRERPPGRRMLRLCRAEACQAMGGAAVAEALLARLRLGWGETAADGEVTVEPVYCLGLCVAAPAALVDGEPVGRITAEALMQRLERS